jgi:hypothetical protein
MGGRRGRLDGRDRRPPTGRGRRVDDFEHLGVGGCLLTTALPLLGALGDVPTIRLRDGLGGLLRATLISLFGDLLDFGVHNGVQLRQRRGEFRKKRFCSAEVLRYLLVGLAQFVGGVVV